MVVNPEVKHDATPQETIEPEMVVNPKEPKHDAIPQEPNEDFHDHDDDFQTPKDNHRKQNKHKKKKHKRKRKKNEQLNRISVPTLAQVTEQ